MPADKGYTNLLSSIACWLIVETTHESRASPHQKQSEPKNTFLLCAKIVIKHPVTLQCAKSYRATPIFKHI